ncbi:hypothetical protein HMPREF0322_03879, partial [Desulfitobacterium hafniense DP7]
REAAQSALFLADTLPYYSHFTRGTGTSLLRKGAALYNKDVVVDSWTVTCRCSYHLLVPEGAATLLGHGDFLIST